MANIYDLIPPAELTAVARLALADEDLADNELVLENLFPLNPVEEIRFGGSLGTTRSYTAAAQFRAFSGTARRGTRPGIERIEGSMPPISIFYELTEYDRLQQEAFRRNAQIDAALVEEDVYNDIDRGIRAIRNRMELFRSDLLLTGSASLAEDGLQITVETGRDAGNEITAPILWSVPATAVPLTDLRAAESYMRSNHRIPKGRLAAMMNQNTWNLMQETTQMREALESTRVLPLITDGDVNSLLTRFSLPNVVINDSQVEDKDGTLLDVIPDNKVLLWDTGTVIGETQFGVPAIANEPEIALARDDRPGPVAYLTRDLNPLVVNTVVDALGIPFAKDANATMVLTV